MTVHTNSILPQLARALLQVAFEQMREGQPLPRAKVARLWLQHCRADDLDARELLGRVRRLGAILPDDAEPAAREALEALDGPLPPEVAEVLVRYLAHVPGQVERQGRLAALLSSPLPEPREALDLLPYVLDRAPRFLPGHLFQGASPLRLERYLGGGGFAEVYLARFTRFRHWAPVVLKCSLLPEGRRWLEYEAAVLDQLAARRCSAGIVQASGIYPDAEVPALQFPWQDGFSIKEVLEFLYRTGNGPSAETVLCVLQCFAGLLGGVHRALYVHRDIKPDNILIRRLPSGKWQLLLLDWGVAGQADRFCPEEFEVGEYTRVLIDRMLINACSVGYASPQRRKGNYLCGCREDVYSTGVVAIQALTGNFRTPVEDYDWEGLLHRRGAPAWLVSLLRCCVHPDHHERPADGDDLFRCLRDRIARPV